MQLQTNPTLYLLRPEKRARKSPKKAENTETLYLFPVSSALFRGSVYRNYEDWAEWIHNFYETNIL